MRNFHKVAFLSLLVILLFTNCKKSSSAAPAYFMKFNANDKTINYTACTENEVIVNDQPYTQITGFNKATGNVGNKQFRITLIEDENKLQSGQVFISQSMNNSNFKNNVLFAYLPDSLSHDYYGFTTASFNPTGTVTLTEVTDTYIKGTFSTSLFDPSDFNGSYLIYAITNGTFYSTHNKHQSVIPL